jgi:N-acyl-D-aspartate/D-glutamate deacylase
MEPRRGLREVAAMEYDLIVRNGLVIDAGGLVAAPVIVDAQTRDDPQIAFDPCATMSCFHRVTTALAGCLAPSCAT